MSQKTRNESFHFYGSSRSDVCYSKHAFSQSITRPLDKYWLTDAVTGFSWSLWFLHKRDILPYFYYYFNFFSVTRSHYITISVTISHHNITLQNHLCQLMLLSLKWYCYQLILLFPKWCYVTGRNYSNGWSSEVTYNETGTHTSY